MVHESPHRQKPSWCRRLAEGLAGITKDGAQLKKNHPPLPFIYLFLWAKQGAQGREGVFTGAGRRDDDTRTVLSTAVTSPEAEEHGVKKKKNNNNDATLSGHGLEIDRPARTFQTDTPLSGARSSK